MTDREPVGDRPAAEPELSQLFGGDEVVLAGGDGADRAFASMHFASLGPGCASPAANCMYVNEFATGLAGFGATVAKCR